MIPTSTGTRLTIVEDRVQHLTEKESHSKNILQPNIPDGRENEPERDHHDSPGVAHRDWDLDLLDEDIRGLGAL